MTTPMLLLQLHEVTGPTMDDLVAAAERVGRDGPIAVEPARAARSLTAMVTRLPLETAILSLGAYATRMNAASRALRIGLEVRYELVGVAAIDEFGVIARRAVGLQLIEDLPATAAAAEAAVGIGAGP